jgi:Transmembrane amino acid transporter protein
MVTLHGCTLFDTEYCIGRVNDHGIIATLLTTILEIISTLFFDRDWWDDLHRGYHVIAISRSILFQSYRTIYEHYRTQIVRDLRPLSLVHNNHREYFDSNTFDFILPLGFIRCDTNHLTLESRPNFDTITGGSSGGGNAAILISMLSTAYMAHYNAPKFYWELQNRSAATYSAVVYQSFMGAILLMIVIAAMGYMTFGTHCQSLILNNYSNTDLFMSLSRWAVVISLIFSYPLAFGGVRDGIYNVLQIRSGNTRRTNQITTVAILCILTFIASIVKDIRIILSLGGATFGNLLSYVFPAFMVVGLARNKTKQNLARKHNRNDTEEPFPTPNQVRFAVVTAVLGIAMGMIGTMKAIQAM